MSDQLSPPSLDEIRAAQDRLGDLVVRTPLLRLPIEDGPAEIYLKCENLQPIGAYKNRPQGAIMTALSKDEARHGVYTASSGNAGLGMAYAARRLGIESRVYTPDSADPAKVAALEALGATVHKISYEDWWQTILNAGHPDDPGGYIDAVRDARALAGNGGIGLEILEDLPDVDTVVAPFGGGGLICGMGAALKTLKPGINLIAAETATATPLRAAMEAGQPVPVEIERSFIQAIGADRVLESMWPMVSALVDDAVAVTLEQSCDAIRTIVSRAHLVAEGAAAVAPAAALAGKTPGRKIVCIVSGGNIDPADMATILEGGIP